MQTASKTAKRGRIEMLNAILLLSPRAQSLMGDDGQDLVEYALIVSLIALAATAGMNTLATDINNAFSNLGTMLTNA
jgi:pilus assembly protein Flp/PilA